VGYSDSKSQIIQMNLDRPIHPMINIKALRGFGSRRRERDGRERKEKKREKLQSSARSVQPPPSSAQSLPSRRSPRQTPQAHLLHFRSLLP
jgi:hypothetical protein